MEPRVGRGGRTEEVFPGALAVYPPMPGLGDFVGGLLAIGGGFGVLALLLTSSADELEPGDKVFFGPVLAVVMLFVGGSRIVGAARQLRSPRPYLLIDGLGLACASGRVAWNSIDRFEAVAEDVDTPRLEMVLAVLVPGTRPAKCKGLVSNGSTERGPNLAFHFWASADRVRETLREFYRGPIDFDGDSPSEAPDGAVRDVAQPLHSSVDDEPGSPAEPRPDRLPLVVVPLIVVIIVVVGVAAALELGKLMPSDDAAGTTSAAPRAGGLTPVREHPSPATSYAQLTAGQATRLAVSDLGTLVGIGSTASDDAQIATSGRRLARTRCYHSGRWKPYWSVSFAGGSPIFESRHDALIFCNRDTHIIEASPPIPH